MIWGELTGVCIIVYKSVHQEIRMGLTFSLTVWVTWLAVDIHYSVLSEKYVVIRENKRTFRVNVELEKNVC